MPFTTWPRVLVQATLAAAVAVALSAPAVAANALYGDMDLLGMGSYPSDPTAGATLEGLSPGSTSYASLITGHGYPFEPAVGEFAGTDQIYVGSVQTGGHDGYSNASERINGPQLIVLDYASLVPAGHTVLTLTLGIAADDFQQPLFFQPFSATLNSQPAIALTAALNGIEQSGPVTRFLTIGVDPALDSGNHVLTLAIDQGGDGGDGWAIDFLTIGVTTLPVPEPASVLLMTLGLAAIGAAARRRG